MKLEATHTALVFPGQGSQSVGMGRDLVERHQSARDLFDEADAVLGLALSSIMWEGPEAALNDTVNTQPALYVHSLASFQVLKSLHPEFTPAMLAGHSLGELSAMAASGALSFADGLRLVRRRGELMKRAGELRPGGMAAILSLDIPTLDGICSSASQGDEVVRVANDNCPGQVVISGSKPAVERAMALAKEAGARRAVPLAVSIAAHSDLMASIQDDWNAAVDAANVVEAEVPLIGNVSAQPTRAAADLRQDVQRQMQSRVRWTESIQHASKVGMTTFVEVGTGTVLLGLIKRIAPGAVGFALGTPSDFEAIE
ncbi:MAG: ACP S-malonyltransferase [Anaerolineales bacterium]